LSRYDRSDNQTERDMPVIALRRSRQPGRQRPGFCLACQISQFFRLSGDLPAHRQGARQ
jgi:hypothetical protein